MSTVTTHKTTTDHKKHHVLRLLFLKTPCKNTTPPQNIFSYDLDLNSLPTPKKDGRTRQGPAVKKQNYASVIRYLSPCVDDGSPEALSYVDATT